MFCTESTPTNIFENLTAAVRLGEQMLRESETVEEFNQKLREQEFGKVNRQLIDSQYYSVYLAAIAHSR